ncbi:transposase [Lentzea sp. NPDC054927]
MADVGDIGRFTTQNRFASWNGNAPLDASSGTRSGTGSPARGPAAPTGSCTSWPWSSSATPTAGRACYNRRKADGKTSMEAMRALKRGLSNVVYARMITDHRLRDVLQSAPPRPLRTGRSSLY